MPWWGAALLLWAAPVGGARAGEARAIPALAPNVLVLGTTDFQRRTLDRLDGLSRTKAGKRLLRRLAATKKSVSVREGTLERSGAVMMPLGRGESVVVWDPAADLPGLPPMIVLHHELLHALFWAEGTRLPAKAEEERALGLGAHAQLDISEGALRRELSLPPRTEHAPLPDAGSPLPEAGSPDAGSSPPPAASPPSTPRTSSAN